MTTPGFFKMIFRRDDGRLLGAHCIGTQATELIHIGQAVLALGGGLDYFLKAVFNYPTRPSATRSPRSTPPTSCSTRASAAVTISDLTRAPGQASRALRNSVGVWPVVSLNALLKGARER